MNKLDSLKLKIIPIFENINIKKVDRETLVELMFLYNAISKESFLEKITNSVKDLQITDQNILDIETRLNSLLLKFSEKKYIQKNRNI